MYVSVCGVCHVLMVTCTWLLCTVRVCVGLYIVWAVEMCVVGIVFVARTTRRVLPLWSWKWTCSLLSISFATRPWMVEVQVGGWFLLIPTQHSSDKFCLQISPTACIDRDSVGSKFNQMIMKWQLSSVSRRQSFNVISVSSKRWEVMWSDYLYLFQMSHPFLLRWLILCQM